MCRKSKKRKGKKGNKIAKGTKRVRGPKPETKTQGRCKVITQMPTYAYDH